mmetsp:Transcript_13220/g.19814  ORF Transcript_13220/g.19814 Transcript_13220/m.19814 type:complete len:232 (-) Transcript_13220:362-1057(-)
MKEDTSMYQIRRTMMAQAEYGVSISMQIIKLLDSRSSWVTRHGIALVECRLGRHGLVARKLRLVNAMKLIRIPIANITTSLCRHCSVELEGSMRRWRLTIVESTLYSLLPKTNGTVHYAELNQVAQVGVHCMELLTDAHSTQNIFASVRTRIRHPSHGKKIRVWVKHQLQIISQIVKESPSMMGSCLSCPKPKRKCSLWTSMQGPTKRRGPGSNLEEKEVSRVNLIRLWMT